MKKRQLLKLPCMYLTNYILFCCFNAKNIGYFFGNYLIEEMVIPSTVEKIEAFAFHGCIRLKKVTLNEGLKEIGYNAFEDTSIESITIPSTVEKIEGAAFFHCNNLTRIDCKLKKSYVKANESSFEGLITKTPIINWLNG